MRVLKTYKKRGGVLLKYLFIQLKRFWRLAEIRLLFLSLLVSVVAVTSVGFFTDRAERAMVLQATQLLGGDLVIVSTRPIDKDFLVEAKKQGLISAQTVTFPSMVSMGDEFKMAQVKAVSKNYPLQGEITVSRHLRDEAKEFDLNKLGLNQTLAEAKLFVALNASAGSEVQLGRSIITLSHIIRKLPDQSTSAFQLAPILILPIDKLDATGLLTVASRASYSYLFTGTESQVSTFKTWLKPKLNTSERLRTLDDGLPTVQNALQRGQRFLKMASLLAVILAGAGIALSSYSLTQHETSAVAVLKTMGASRRQILWRYLGQILLFATLAGVIGAALGYFIQTLLALSLQEFVGDSLPNASWKPVVIGFITAWVMAVGFSAPQLIQLINIAPIQILQGQRVASKKTFLSSRYFSFVSLSSAVFLIMFLQTQDTKLSLILLGAVLVALFVFWVVAMLSLYLLRKLGQHLKLPKTNQRMAVMVVVFGIGLFSLLLLTTLRSDLIDRWQDSIPVGAPNHFFINIQPDEVKPLQAFLSKELAVKNAPLYPMLLGRLVGINNETISPDDEQFTNNERAQRLLIREFNLSATVTIPEGNNISTGKWFDKNDREGLSVEQGIAETLNIKMGDQLTFDIAGQRVAEKITSLREVKWDSMKPNFFVLLAPQAMKDHPKTYITSVHIEDNKLAQLPQMVRQFPSVTDIDVSAILKQVRGLINKAAFAVQAIFLFTLVAGIVVLFSALQSQKALRRKEIAILKSMGASRAFLRRSLLLEFSMVGGLAGFLAGVLATLVGNIAAYLLFDLSPDINISLVVMGTLIGALLVGVAGYFNVRGLLNVLPVTLFR